MRKKKNTILPRLVMLALFITVFLVGTRLNVTAAGENAQSSTSEIQLSSANNQVSTSASDSNQNENISYSVMSAKPSLPKEGFVSGTEYGLADGQWYVRNSQVQSDLTDVIYYNGSWYNVVKGRLALGPTVAHNKNGWWYIDQSGRVDFSYTGIAKNVFGEWYLKGGKVNFNINGIVNTPTGQWYVKGDQVQRVTDVIYTNGSWYNIVNGQVKTGPTVAHNKNGWWYIGSDGRVNFKYTGLADNQYGTWYLSGGKIDFKKTDVINTKYNGIGGWWDIAGGKLVKGPTVAHNRYGWWYINQNGKVDFNHNGVESNIYGSWKITNGKVDFNFNGLADSTTGTWYLKNGKVDTSTSDVIYTNYNGTKAWWNVRNGKLQKKIDVAYNKNGWWYIGADGKVDFNFTGLADNANGTWYLSGGKVDFKKTDVLNANYKGVNAIWHIVAGKLTKGPTVAHNKSGWWYIGTDGRVNTSFEGIASNQYGTWYLNNGKVGFNTTDVLTFGGTSYNIVGSKVTPGPSLAKKSSDGKWYYINANGVVDYTFNGVATGSIGTYYCSNGVVNDQANGLVSGINGTFYVTNGRVNTGVTELMQFAGNKNYYNIVKGKLTAGPFVGEIKTGLEKGWWYVNTSGMRDTSFTGIASNSNGTWYLKNGKVGFDVTDVLSFNGIWYNLENSKVTPGPSIAKNGYGTWFINSNGVVDFTANYSNYGYGGRTYVVTNGKAVENSKRIAGIDVSHWQNDINWKQVTKDAAFAIVKLGGRTRDSDRALYTDKKFETNISGAKKDGLEVGVYFYSNAQTEAQAKEEARYCANVLKKNGTRLDLPVFFDIEEEKTQGNDYLNNAQRTAIVNAFCNTIRSYGYQAGVYANKTWLTKYLNMSQINNATVWCAQYNSKCTYNGAYNIWQYSNKGNVSGISGHVDLDYWYVR